MSFKAYPTVQKILASGGSGWGSFEPAGPLRDLKSVKVGDILLSDNKQFDSKNVLKIVEVHGDKLYGQFVNPQNTSQLRRPDDRVFVIWDFDLDKGEYFLPKR